MTSSKSRAEYKAENRLLRAHGFGSGLVKVLQQLIKYGGFVLIAWHVQLAITSLSGKHTYADIVVRADGNMNMGDGVKPDGESGQAPACPQLEDQGLSPQDALAIICFFLALVAISYGRAQARLRRDVIERMHPYQEAFEKQRDPGRTSSRLTRTGETRPEDV